MHVENHQASSSMGELTRARSGVKASSACDLPGFFGPVAPVERSPSADPPRTFV